ncbi:MAG: DUF72 domain-containing protein [Candidatus Marinimicrobia bacterium]|nr:DUF72 domain-containing protein [Candidatus Neomarinimicrobiota bacterium]MCF7828545.1 DUF72 domain-containing protein [Candidatus Neomarinimicrobiota bacterium]MCF7882032.1 DUF72 domain-containing protein [Candidatus Neomarinimicrobiota bacterium]
MDSDLRIGCSGWYYDDWIDRFYPGDMDKREWLSFYAERFPVVEVKSTFYHFQKKKTLRGWYERTPDDFRFILKANRQITHRQRFSETGDLIARFYGLAKYLGEKLGGILFQLPPSVEKDMGLLESIADQLSLRQTNFLEFRHASWFDKPVYEFLRDKNVGFCCVSVKGMPEDCIATTDTSYIRFHGKEEWYRYLYSEKELTAWADKIRRLEAETIYGFFNNDYQGNAIQNAGQLREILTE